jgi:phospholipase/lecithinase/hemolysin
MKKIILLCLLSGVAFAQQGFSNFIFFGDSLVDVGNFPSSADVFVSPHVKKNNLSPDDYTSSLYVPISNPVNARGKFFNISEYALNAAEKFKLPEVIPPRALLKSPRINAKQRRSRSMLWPEFLLSDANAMHLVQSNTLLPRTALDLAYNKKITLNDSINYAWISALTDNTCASESFVTFPGVCSYDSSLKTLKKYISIRSDKYKEQVRIPGLNAQVNWFVKDLARDKVSVNDKTAVFILVGGNDMNKSFSALQTAKFTKKMSAAGDLIAGTSHNVYKAMQKLALINGHKIQHIYLLTLFNPRWTPRLVLWPKSLQHLATVFVNMYNAGLRVAAWRIRHKYSWVDVKVVPMRDWFDNWAQAKGQFAPAFPKSKQGIACQVANPAYNQSVTPKDNCLGYLFWNAVHPSMQTEQLIAYKLLQYL